MKQPKWVKDFPQTPMESYITIIYFVDIRKPKRSRGCCCLNVFKLKGK